jgi:hypothetical protein
MDVATVFKFRPINKRMIESLINAEVYFSTPEKLNDPFDSQIDLKNSLDTAISKVSGDEEKVLMSLKDHMNDFLAEVNRMVKEYGVWSYSLELKNSLMWAHYADEHRGICLIYDLPDNFRNHNLGEVIGNSAVDYGNNLIVEYFIEFSQNQDRPVFRQFATLLFIKLLTSKDKCWEYEKEGRVISKQAGIKTIGKTALRQVCFGLRTPENDKALVREILDKHGYHVTIGKMERDENDFGLRPVIVDEM